MYIEIVPWPSILNWIFSIETKDMKGWIFGGEKQPIWTQKIYRHTSQFQNPLFQNRKYTQTLQQLLGLRDEQVFSVVTFVGESEFRTPMPPNVTQGGGFVGYVKSKGEVLLFDQEVSNILKEINDKMLPRSFRTDREHVRHLRRKAGKPG